MQHLVLLVLNLVAYCSSFGEPTEDDVISNIACSVYEYKKQQNEANVSPSKNLPRVFLTNPNVVTIDESAPKCTPKKKPCDKCMGNLGCFNCMAFGLGGLPVSESDIKTSFQLYNKDNQKGLKFSYDDITPVLEVIKKPTQLSFIVHGFHSSAKHEWVPHLKANLLENQDDGTVIIVDWSSGASAKYSYMQAIRNSQVVGRQVASVLHQLMQETRGKVNYKRTHWIGHGLGAQLAIFFWEHFKHLSENLIIGKITALDPAKAFFEDFQFNVNVTMARFVEVIHTSTGSVQGLSFGMANPIGHIDFYVNGGSAPQPGCDDFLSKSASCSHARATSYYIEAIQRDSNCTMISYACTGGLDQYLADKCEIDEDYWNIISLNETESFPGRGIQFVDTHEGAPFCKIIGKTDSD